MELGHMIMLTNLTHNAQSVNWKPKNDETVVVNVVQRSESQESQ